MPPHAILRQTKRHSSATCSWVGRKRGSCNRVYKQPAPRLFSTESITRLSPPSACCWSSQRPFGQLELLPFALAICSRNVTILRVPLTMELHANSHTRYASTCWKQHLLSERVTSGKPEAPGQRVRASPRHQHCHLRLGVAPRATMIFT